jgi:hypothetical protein
LVLGFIVFQKNVTLGNATALDCANYTVSMFSDLKNGYASKLTA